MAQPPAPRSGRPLTLRDLVNQRVTVFNRSHPQQQIDPRAALAVAAQEGLGGGIGDGGHAFGPFQLNDAGGVLTGKFPGETPQQLQAWASSPAGIDYALGGIGKVAGGTSGRAAVTNIVSRFERPANIPGETSRALAAYGLPGEAGPTITGAPATAPPGQGSAPSLIRAAAAPVQAPVDYQPQLAAAAAQAASSPTNDLRPFYSALQQALRSRQQAAPVRPSASY
jgi:hypothetical protein